MEKKYNININILTEKNKKIAMKMIFYLFIIFIIIEKYKTKIEKKLNNIYNIT